jgi:hypothetical protein
LILITAEEITKGNADGSPSSKKHGDHKIMKNKQSSWEESSGKHPKKITSCRRFLGWRAGDSMGKGEIQEWTADIF